MRNGTRKRKRNKEVWGAQKGIALGAHRVRPLNSRFDLIVKRIEFVGISPCGQYKVSCWDLTERPTQKSLGSHRAANQVVRGPVVLVQDFDHERRPRQPRVQLDALKEVWVALVLDEVQAVVVHLQQTRIHTTTPPTHTTPNRTITTNPALFQHQTTERTRAQPRPREKSTQTKQSERAEALLQARARRAHRTERPNRSKAEKALARGSRQNEERRLQTRARAALVPASQWQEF